MTRKRKYFDIRIHNGRLCKAASYQWDKSTPIALGDACTVNETIWQQWRQHGPDYADPTSDRYIPVTVGGSDVAIVCNVSPWTTAFELYEKKAGFRPVITKQFNATSKELGHIYEDAIAKAFGFWFRQKYPWKNLIINNDTHMYQCGRVKADGTLKYPWAVANLDRRIYIDGNEGILEIKMTSYRNVDVIKEWQAGIVPIYYELQCRHYMAVMNVKYCYICCAWGLQLDQMAVIRIDRDYSIENEILDICSMFVDCVKDKHAPNPDDCIAPLLNEYYYRKYGAVDPSAPTLELPEKYRGVILEMIAAEENYERCKKEVDKAEHRKEEAVRTLYPLFGNSSYGTFRMNDHQVACIKLKTPMTRTGFDHEKFIKDHPDMTDVNSYGVLTVNSKKLKEDNLALYKQYEIPPTPSTDPERKNSFELKLKDM